MMAPMMPGSMQMSPYATKEQKRRTKMARKEMKDRSKIPPLAPMTEAGT